MKVKSAVTLSVIAVLVVAAIVVMIWFNPFAAAPVPPKTTKVKRGELVESAAFDVHDLAVLGQSARRNDGRAALRPP